MQGIAHAQHAAFDHPGIEPAMATHRIETAWAQQLFHARTRVAWPGDFEHHRIPDVHMQRLVLEQSACRQQVQARHDQVAPQPCRIYPIQPGEGRDGWQVLGLDERNLPLATACAAGRLQRRAVALQASAHQGLRFEHRQHGLTPLRSEVNRLDPARVGKLASQFMQGGQGGHVDGVRRLG